MGKIIAYNSKSPNNGPYGQYMVGGLVQQPVYYYSQYMENKKNCPNHQPVWDSESPSLPTFDHCLKLAVVPNLQRCQKNNETH